MRLLLLSNMYPRAGAEHSGSFVASRVRALRSLGVEVDLLALVTDSPLYTPTPAFADVDWRSIDVRWGYPSRVLSRIWPAAFKEPWIADQVLEKVASNYDAVVAHGMYLPPAGIVARRVARELRIPYVVHVHGSDVNQVVARFPRRLTRVLNDASGVLFVSDALRTRARQLGYRGSHDAVVPNGVDTDLFHSTRSPSARKRVAFVGNLEFVKGADRLPAIFAELRNLEPDVDLSIVGGGSLRRQIEDGLRNRHLDDVRLWGAVDQSVVARIMRSTDVLVMPSRSEGWPCVVLEAHASGCQVVGTDVGGTAEALGDSNFVVPHDDLVVTALASAAHRALASETPDAAARRLRAQTFDWRETVKSELQLVRSILP